MKSVVGSCPCDPPKKKKRKGGKEGKELQLDHFGMRRGEGSLSRRRRKKKNERGNCCQRRRRDRAFLEFFWSSFALLCVVGRWCGFGACGRKEGERGRTVPWKSISPKRRRKRAGRKPVKGGRKELPFMQLPLLLPLPPFLSPM